MKKEIDEGLRMLLAITKTSGNLGRNEQRKGTWDRLGGGGGGAGQAKIPSKNAAALQLRYTAIVPPRHFCLLDWLNPIPSNDPQAPLR